MEKSRKEGRVRGRERTDSVGVLEMWKRKREVEGETVGRAEWEEELASKRSRKTTRSPEKEGEDLITVGMMNRWMEELKGMWERMEERMEERMTVVMVELDNMRKREEEWRVERERMEKRIEDLEKKWEEGPRHEGKEKMEDLERRMRRLECGEGKEGREGELGGGKVVERINKLEQILERKERVERRRNIVVKGFKGGDGNVEEKIKRIFDQIAAEVKIEEVREVKAGRGDWGGLAVVKLRSEEDKKEVMRKKKGLRGGDIWIGDDLTWKERQSRWRFRKIVKAEERKGAKVWIGESKALINGVWWFWDEEEERIRKGWGRKGGEEEVLGEGRERA